ncbi:MAG: AI-2E family transporter [Clostridia bacterium]|nr:AI-2E family transporter [Clostridia bacterium]
MFMEDPKNRKTLGKWVLILFALCCCIYLALSNLSDVGGAIAFVKRLLNPLIIGFILAVVINVPMSFIEKHLFAKTKNKTLQRLRHPLAVICAIVLIIVLLVGIFTLIIPELIHVVSFVIQIAEDVIDMLAKADQEENFFTQFNINWEQIKQQVMSWLKNSSGDLLSGAANVFGSAAGGVMDVVFAVIFALYMLAGKQRLLRQLQRLMRAWLPDKFTTPAIHVGQVFSASFHAFIVGQVTEAAILGSLCALGMLVLGLPYAAMIGVLVGVCALVPIVGGYTSAIVGTFIILTVDPVKALIFLIYLIILQQIEGNLIYPRVVGGKINLPGIWVLAAVTIGGGLAGPFGMLLGVPTASALYALVKEKTAERERKKLQEATQQ